MLFTTLPYLWKTTKFYILGIKQRGEKVNVKSVWQGVLGEIELSVHPSLFTTWFSKTELEEVRDGRAVVAVPNIFVKAQMDKKFKPQVVEVLKRTGVAPEGVIFEVKTSGKKKPISHYR